jgi:ribose-phosphate pyrophosphokinase
MFEILSGQLVEDENGTPSFKPYTIPFKTWNFPSKETGFKLEIPDDVKLDKSDFSVLWQYEGDHEVMILGQIRDALYDYSGGNAGVSLVMPYLPHGRQDRRCHKGEGHSLGVFASIINSMSFHTVVTFDVHNPVVFNDLFANALNVNQATCASNMSEKYDYFIAPDAGAAKKIGDHNDVRSGRTKVFVMSKQRIGGKVVYNEAPSDEIPEGSSVCVMDDLCDGGATFLALAESFGKERLSKFEKFDLYVTHGLFTNRETFEKLSKIYGKIWVLNLVNKTVEHAVTVLKGNRPYEN